MGSTSIDWWCVDPSTYGTPNMTLDNTTYHLCYDSDVVSPNGVRNIKVNANGGFLTNGGYNVSSAASQISTNGGGACVRYFDPSIKSIISEVGIQIHIQYFSKLLKFIEPKIEKDQ